MNTLKPPRTPCTRSRTPRTRKHWCSSPTSSSTATASSPWGNAAPPKAFSKGMATGRIVTLTTDFGQRDPFVGVMKGVILGICREATLIDLTHEIAAFDIREGAVALESAWRFFPMGTIHLAVVDPGVGGRRRGLALEAGGHYFVGPDNGLFSFALTRGKCSAIS